MKAEKTQTESPSRVIQSQSNYMKGKMIINNRAGFVSQTKMIETIQGKRIEEQSSVISQFQKYNSVKDITNPKFLASNLSFSEEQILQIANWCHEHKTNAIKRAYPSDYIIRWSTTTDNGKEYEFIFVWSLALHLDLAGPPHNSIPTPHLQIVGGIEGGSSSAQIEVNSSSLLNRLQFSNTHNNAVEVTFAQANKCMEDESIDSIKEMIYEKVFIFSRKWASTYADEDSGAKAERMAKEVDLGDIDWFGEDF